MKTLHWMGGTEKEVSKWPVETRQRVAHELEVIRDGLDPSDWKPVKVVGPGVRELRIKVKGAYRLLYVTNIGEAVYVLHAFQKKTEKIPTKDLELARQRYRAINR